MFLGDLEAPAEVWNTTLAHLHGRYRSYVIQVAGFAGSPPVAAPLIPKLHRQLARFVRERARGAVLVGHMFGAGLAYWLAMTEPDLVNGVVAIDAPPSRNAGHVDPEVEAVRRKLATATPEQYARMVRRRITSMITNPELARKIANRAVLTSQTVDAEAFYDMMSRNLRPQIPKIRAPVLVLLTTGNLPPGMLPRVERLYRGQLAPVPRHELAVIPGSKHYVMFDAPKLFFAYLDRFLRKNARRAKPR